MFGMLFPQRHTHTLLYALELGNLTLLSFFYTPQPHLSLHSVPTVFFTSLSVLQVTLSATVSYSPAIQNSS